MYKIIVSIPVWGEHDADTIAQIQRCASDDRVHGAALLADGHKGYSMPIGGVVAYHDAVSPSGVGYDIGCGLKGVRTDIHADQIRPQIGKIMDDIARTVVFGIGRTSGENVDHPLFDDPTWRDIREIGRLKQMAQGQLVHNQTRRCVMSYSGRYERTYICASTYGRGGAGLGGGTALE